MDSPFEQARRIFLEGVAHYQAGRLAQAEQQFAAAQALVPGRPSVLTNLGAVRLKLGRPEEALAALQEALEREPTTPRRWASAPPRTRNWATGTRRWRCSTGRSRWTASVPHCGRCAARCCGNWDKPKPLRNRSGKPCSAVGTPN